MCLYNYIWRYLKNNRSNDTFTDTLIIPATIRDVSFIKYPWINHNILVNNNKHNEYNDKSSTCLVWYDLYNCGNSYTQFTIGANTATVLANDIIVFLL